MEHVNLLCLETNTMSSLKYAIKTANLSGEAPQFSLNQPVSC